MILAVGCSTDQVVLPQPPKPKSTFAELSNKKLRFATAIQAPMFVAASESSMVVHDLMSGRPQFLKANQTNFPISLKGLDGEQVKGSRLAFVGYDNHEPDSLLIGTDAEVRKYHPVTMTYGSVVDNFAPCPAFNNFYAQCFSFSVDDEEYVLMPRSTPCINQARDGKSYSLSDFGSIQFAQLKNLRTEETKPVFAIPSDNEIIADKMFYSRTFAAISSGNRAGEFYALINPTTQVSRFKFDRPTKDLILAGSWMLNLPYFDNTSPQVLNQGWEPIRSAAQTTFRNNPEVKFFSVHNDTAVVYYQPGIPEDEFLDSPFQSSYLLGAVVLSTGESVVYSVDYNEFIILGALKNGRIWAYDLRESELDSTVVSVVRSVSVGDLFVNQ